MSLANHFLELLTSIAMSWSIVMMGIGVFYGQYLEMVFYAVAAIIFMGIYREAIIENAKENS